MRDKRHVIISIKEFNKKRDNFIYRLWSLTSIVKYNGTLNNKYLWLGYSTGPQLFIRCNGDDEMNKLNDELIKLRDMYYPKRKKVRSGNGDN
jgi:hypothetical protein